MAKKGVKKIAWNGEGTVYKDKSVPGHSIVIEGGTTVGFKVGEWFPGTTEAEKNKQVTWFRQSHDKKVDYFKDTRSSSKPYTLFISKAQAGKVGYYVEASLTGFKDLSGDTGLFVRAYSPPRVVSSYWRENIEGNNKQIHEGNPTQYNVPLHLHLELEGLNGYNCTVHIYNCEFNLFGDNNQKISKTYAAKCNKGELDIYIPAGDVLQWRKEIGAEKPLEQFYVLLSVEGAKGYVKDTTPKGDLKHATHLFIKNSFGKILTKVVPLPKGNKVITIGEEEKKPIKYEPCKFKSISITDRGDFKLIFDENNAKTFGVGSDKFVLSLDIFYDTDQAEIRSDAKPVLDNLIQALKHNPEIPLTIESYTDIRQTAEYNKDLSERRANGVLSYLYTHGVKNDLKAHGYGESKALQFIYLTNEDTPLHQANRHTMISFKTYNLRSLMYNTIVPTILLPTTLDITVDKYVTEACLMGKNPKDKHDHTKAHYLELTNEKEVRKVVKDLSINGGKLKLEVFANKTPMLPMPWYLTPQRFEVSINSCSYFPDKNKPTLIVNAFTDALWMFHATYDYDGDYFFKRKGVPQNVKLIKGIERLYAKLEQYIEFYLRFIDYVPLVPGGSIVQRWIIDYIREDAKMYGLSYAKRSNWVGNQYNVDDDYTGDNAIVTEVGILTLTLLVIVVEVLITILTMGEAAVAKLPKLKKAARLAKKVADVMEKMDSLGFSFVFPKVAFNRGVYYEKKPDGNVYFMLEENVSAKPIIGIDFKKDFSLAKLITKAAMGKKPEKPEPKSFQEAAEQQIEDKVDGFTKSKVNEGVQELLDKAGKDAMITIEFNGSIEAEYNVKLAIPATQNQGYKKVTITNYLNKAFSNTEGKVISTNTVKGDAKLRLTNRIAVYKWLPLVPYKSGLKIDSVFALAISGYITHTRTYGFETYGGPYYQDSIYFSGIKGSVMITSKMSTNKKKVFEVNPDNKPMQFTLFEHQNIVIKKVNLY